MQSVTLEQLSALDHDRAVRCKSLYDEIFANVSEANAKGYSNYFADVEKDSYTFADKVFALHTALSNDVFFQVEMGAQGGMLTIRESKNQKPVALRFDVHWGKEEGVDAGHIVFGQTESGLYPELTRLLSQIEIVDDRMLDVNFVLSDNQVKLNGAIGEKCLAYIGESDKAGIVFDEIKNKRLQFTQKQEQEQANTSSLDLS